MKSSDDLIASPIKAPASPLTGLVEEKTTAFYYRSDTTAQKGFTPNRKNIIPLRQKGRHKPDPQGFAHMHLRLPNGKIVNEHTPAEDSSTNLALSLLNVTNRTNRDAEYARRGSGIDPNHFIFAKESTKRCAERFREVFQAISQKEGETLLEKINERIEEGQLNNPFEVAELYSGSEYKKEEALNSNAHSRPVSPDDLKPNLKKRKEPEPSEKPNEEATAKDTVPFSISKSVLAFIPRQVLKRAKAKVAPATEKSSVESAATAPKSSM